MKWAFWIYLVLYAAALLLFGISTFGWFGQERDPLGAVFLMPLGLPWNLLADRIGVAPLVILVAAPLVNAGILLVIWKLLRRRSVA